MKKILLVFFIIFSALAFSQEVGGIKGTIVDRQLRDEPLFFANIALKNADMIAQTNFHGNFEFLNIRPGNYTLVVSYPGYETLEVPVAVVEDEVTLVSEGLTPKSIPSEDVAIGTVASK